MGLISVTHFSTGNVGQFQKPFGHMSPTHWTRVARSDQHRGVVRRLRTSALPPVMLVAHRVILDSPFLSTSSRRWWFARVSRNRMFSCRQIAKSALATRALLVPMTAPCGGRNPDHRFKVFFWMGGWGGVCFFFGGGEGGGEGGFFGGFFWRGFLFFFIAPPPARPPPNGFRDKELRQRFSVAGRESRLSLRPANKP